MWLQERTSTNTNESDAGADKDSDTSGVRGGWNYDEEADEDIGEEIESGELESD